MSFDEARKRAGRARRRMEYSRARAIHDEHRPTWLTDDGEQLVVDLTVWLAEETRLDAHRDYGDESEAA